MNPLGIATAIVSGIVSTGAGAVVGNAIKATTPEDLNLYKKVTISAGAFVLSAAAGSFASRYASEQIASTVTSVQELKNNLRKKN